MTSETKLLRRLNPRIKHTYRIDARREQEIELYHGANTVLKVVHSNRKAYDYLRHLEHYINGTIIQSHRVRIYSSIAFSAYHEISDNASFARWNDTLLMMFLEIHFYVICLEKVENLHAGFQASINDLFVNAPEEVRERRKQIKKSFKRALSAVNDTRNFLEHMDEKIERGDFKDLDLSIGSAEDSTFSWGKPKKCLRIDSQPITQAYEALIEFLRSLPNSD
jgi:hypothetical protein